MKLKSTIIKPIAGYTAKNIKKEARRAVEHQEETRQELLHKASDTIFGKEHQFKNIQTYEDFKQALPIRDYEALRPYIDKILKGEKNVLWKGKPLYFAKTSGTTSGTKYIPISKESIKHHFSSARNALFLYAYETGNYSFFDGSLMFLSGSPVLDKKAGIHTGRLSGIVNHHIPYIFRRNQVPDYSTNCIEDWEQKVDAIVEETYAKDMRLIGGIPPWVQMYFDRLRKKSGGRFVKDIFKNLSVYVHGGVNFQPYRSRMTESIGKEIDRVETYPASEGFIAYQYSQEKEGLLLNTNAGMFYEFVPANRFFEDNPPRYDLSQVEKGVNYALIINSNAGLWGYSIGDTIEFVETDIPLIKVSGRIKHFISAFGEHVIGQEVDKAMLEACQKHTEVHINEFTLAPQIQVTGNQLPHHEWFIEFENPPKNLKAFAKDIDESLCRQNSYYNDLIEGGILQTLIIRSLPKGAFQQYMKSIGKLGGQNKVPRLANDRKIVDVLEDMV